MRKALAATGMDAASIEAEIAKRPVPAPAAIELDVDDEGRAAAIFLAMDTQWSWTTTGIVGGNGGFSMRTGLNYQSIEPAARGLGVGVDPQVFADLRTLETEALKTFAEARA